MDRTTDARLHLSGGRAAVPRLFESGGRRTSTRKRASAAHTVDKLTVHALSCALQSELDQAAAVDALLHIAAGNRSAVVRALRRIDQPGRLRTPAGQRAALLLRLALAKGAWRWGGVSPAEAGAGRA